MTTLPTARRKVRVRSRRHCRRRRPHDWLTRDAAESVSLRKRRHFVASSAVPAPTPVHGAVLAAARGTDTVKQLRRAGVASVTVGLVTVTRVVLVTDDTAALPSLCGVVGRDHCSVTLGASPAESPTRPGEQPARRPGPARAPTPMRPGIAVNRATAVPSAVVERSRFRARWGTTAWRHGTSVRLVSTSCPATSAASTTGGASPSITVTTLVAGDHRAVRLDVM